MGIDDGIFELADAEFARMMGLDRGLDKRMEFRWESGGDKMCWMCVFRGRDDYGKRVSERFGYPCMGCDGEGYYRYVER